MTLVLWLGAALALAGLAALLWCIREARRIARAAPPPDEARRAFARLQAINLAAVSTAFLGLAAVAVAAILS
ncbi:MAG: hypothetical protein AAGI51_17750 [Pseudomonadota bacterium]